MLRFVGRVRRGAHATSAAAKCAVVSCIYNETIAHRYLGKERNGEAKLMSSKMKKCAENCPAVYTAV